MAKNRLGGKCLRIVCCELRPVGFSTNTKDVRSSVGTVRLQFSSVGQQFSRFPRY